MTKPFYSRLAAANLRKNRSLYVPYLLAGTAMIALFCILCSITAMVMDSGMEGGGTMGSILAMSSIVCGFLSLVVLFYLNSFVIKRRKRELGLYCILGMEKRHISLVMLWEVALTGIISIVVGVGGGALLSQLLFLVLLRLVGFPVTLTFQLPLGAAAATALLFAVGYGLVLVFDIVQIYRTDPIELLASAKVGEREPKARWFLAGLGVLTLAVGYGLALLADTPSNTLLAFFPAVCLVITGTYLLFVAGSIALLKLLRRRKSFYYQPDNFVAVSGMLYRMKQNAMGLANICILSTCVLVTLSSTLSLFLGEEDALRLSYPRQVQATCRVEGQNQDLLVKAAADYVAQNGMAVADDYGYLEFSYYATRSTVGFPMDANFGMGGYAVTALTLEDYNRNTGESYTLEPGQILLFASGRPVAEEKIALGSAVYEVKEQIPTPTFLDETGATQYAVAVLPDWQGLEQLWQESQDIGAPRDLWYRYYFDVEGDEAGLPAIYDREAMGEAMLQTVPNMGRVYNIQLAKEDFYQSFGSLLFVGIFFVALFLIATVVIIYYKQITEGFDDHDRFHIMGQVGMGRREVKEAIQKQVLLVFFLPLGLAVLHMAVAFPSLCKMLTLFHMTNTVLFLCCALGTVLVFLAFYFGVYQLTARTYYRIVQGER